MGNILKLFFDWSEVWAILIPLLVLIGKNKQPYFLKPVIIYLWLALFLNLVGNIIGDFKTFLPDWLHSNNILYNIHSIIRFACFSYFFYFLKQTSNITAERVISLAAIVYLIFNFSYVEDFYNPTHLSGNLLATEAYVLLIFCLRYYLFQLRNEIEVLKNSKDFWVVTGLSIYVVINFFVFLFYVPMIKEDPDLADKMWSVHNVAYIILCMFIAKAFYEPIRNQFTV